MAENYEQQLIQIQGQVEREVFVNKENGFAVLKIKLDDGQSHFLSGILPNVFVGEELIVSGNWNNHPKFGRQFKSHSFTKKKPSSKQAIEKYLGSGLIKGIGPGLAKRIVNYFGDQTLEIFEKDPEKICKVPGIGSGKISQVIQAWQDQKHISQIMIFLKSIDISTLLAVKIFKKYGIASVEKIQEDPYRLVQDLWGIGFKKADQIALKIGLAPDSEKRIKAGIKHFFKTILEQGSLYFEEKKSIDQICKILSSAFVLIPSLVVEQNIEILKAEDFLIQVKKNDQILLGLKICFVCEKEIAQKIQELYKYSKKAVSNSLKLIENTEEKLKSKISLTPEQKDAVESCLQNKINIITGGPGTGKTTILKFLTTLLKIENISFKLAAPTGRAAKRIEESTFCKASTIHRLLEFNPAMYKFEKNHLNTIDASFVIVDEFSMVDTFLALHLFKALNQKTHLIILGDVDQLASVGPGSVFKDMIDSQTIKVTRLTKIFRQAQTSLIVKNAHRINQGEFPLKPADKKNTDFIFIPMQDPEDLNPFLQTYFKKFLLAKKISHFNNIILTPMHKGIPGSINLNNVSQQILNSGEKDKISFFNFDLKINDPVLQTKNNYDLNVFNGDIGIVSKINSSSKSIVVQFPDKSVNYLPEHISQLSLCYAMSIHKSQGSEFESVVVPIFTQHFMMLQKNILYTAITRAKKMCVLIGQPKALAMAIKNEKLSERITLLKDFLKGIEN